VQRSSQPKNGRGSPEMLADRLMTQIFRGDFAPGSHLPAERQLAAQLGVDRTTLRMALKQLQRMNLIVVRHGSGIEVNDYRVSGGLDVLASLFSLEDVPLEGSFLFEALDFWLDFFSMMAAKAIVRMSVEDMRAIDRILDAAINAGDDVDAFVLAEMEVQDALARLSGSVLLRMLHNSTRSLRVRIARLLPETVDVAASFTELKGLVRDAALNRPSEEVLRARLLEALKRLIAPLRERFLFGTQGA
jgi:DNA-binding FadR family transcriptional regulator